MNTSRSTAEGTIIINGREYPAELYEIAREHEASGGTFCEAVNALRALVDDKSRAQEGEKR